MASLKFCANLSFMFQETGNTLNRYALAKAAGFKAVELAFPYKFLPEDVRAAQLNADVEQILININPGDKGELGRAALIGNESKFREDLEQAIRYAKALKCKLIHIMSGVVQEEVPENMQVLITNLKYAANELRKHHIIGLIEPINDYSVPKYFMNSFDRAIDVLKAVGSEQIKLLLDMYHLQIISGNLNRNIEKLLPYTAHVQIAQVPDRHEPDSEGEINYKYILRRLEDLKYSGWIGLEYFPKKATLEGLNWLKDFGYEL